MSTTLLFAAGGVALIAGAELLVRGAARLAVAAGLAPLVVGLTVVAFGTSAPELAVTAGAAWSGQGGVAIGNVIGSNIFNVLFILGVSAVIAPLVVSHDLVRLDVPIMIGASVLALLLAADGSLGRGDGALLFTGMLVYTGYLIVRGRRPGDNGAASGEGDGAPAQDPVAAGARPAGTVDGDDPAPYGGRRDGGWIRDVGLIAGGLVLLVLGAQWLVDAAVDTARSLGMSELVVGLTIVAAGTSLPEVATSILASVRGQRDIAVGNVVGSNLFNLFAVLGVGGLVAPEGLPVSTGVLTFDFPVMIGVAVATLPIFFTGYLIARWEGLVFLGYYAAYALFLVLDASLHPVADEFGAAITWFVLPLTALTVVILAVRALRQRATMADGPVGDTPDCAGAAPPG